MVVPGRAAPAIRVLPAAVAARIAAGEVVERPASVVKELLENSLDAGASRISVEVAGGGLETIRVSDDGCGIEQDDLLVAFERHATSKLDGGDDLSRILTLGFRGEALPSIAAVAEVEMVSRPPQRQAGGYARLAPESPPETGPRGAPAGACVTVRRLFARLPARRKFLRSPSSESAAVASVVTHCALAYPEVRFSLTTDGRETLSTPGSGYLRDAVSAVYGPELAGEMLVVGREKGAEEDRGVAVRGLAAPPHVSRASRGYVSLFVNRRWIANRRLVFAVEEAYQGMLMVGRHPVAVLEIELPHEEVDVNVHPTKAEVRFRDESAVFGALQRAVRRALLEYAPVPQPLPSGAALSPTAWTPPLWRHAVRLDASREAGVAPAEIGGNGAGPALEAVPSAGSTPRDALPVLRVLGQLGGTYVVAEGPDGGPAELRTGMYLIDQHAAHERVLYERFRAGRQRRQPDVQGLLEAVSVELPGRQRALLEEHQTELQEHGFGLEAFGESAYLIRALPRQLASGDVRGNVQRFLDLMLEEGEGDGRDRVAMSLACHGAIRAGKTLSMEEMRDLMGQLEATESPHTCPHGRPTMIHMSVDLLAREFGRR